MESDSPGHISKQCAAMADSTCSTGTQAGSSFQGVAAELAALSGYVALDPACTSYAKEWFSGMTVKVMLSCFC